MGNTYDFPVNMPVKYEDLEEIDKWALTRLNKLIRDCTEAYENYDFHNAYQAINQFCVVDMSTFYLDIIKDRLYTYKHDSIERRSAQTVMYEILNALVRILAPMTCFTAEEIWQNMSHRDGEDVESVMLTYYPEVNPKYDNDEIVKRWDKIIKLKEDVSKRLEEARIDKVIGHSLNAKVTLFAEGDLYKELNDDCELLKTVFIVSDVVVDNNKRENDGEIGIKVEMADGKKCERCWMYSDTVGRIAGHPTICKRCSENMK